MTVLTRVNTYRTRTCAVLEWRGVVRHEAQSIKFPVCMPAISAEIGDRCATYMPLSVVAMRSRTITYCVVAYGCPPPVYTPSHSLCAVYLALLCYLVPPGTVHATWHQAILPIGGAVPSISRSKQNLVILVTTQGAILWIVGEGGGTRKRGMSARERKQREFVGILPESAHPRL